MRRWAGSVMQAARACRWLLWGALGLACGSAAGAARIAAVVPQGEVAQVRQVQLRFSEAVVPAGDPRLPAPVALLCNGRTPPGTARWASDRLWVYDLTEPLAAGSRCTLEPDPAFQPLGGALQGPTRFGFSTGAPVVLGTQPWAGALVEEDQHFLLRLNGQPDDDSVRRHAWCEVEGLGERIPVRLLQGDERARALRALRRDPAEGGLVLLGCQRPFPADAGVRLVWGAGIAAAGQPRLVSRREQRFQWKVRPRFTAELSCERENAQSPCLPLRPLSLRFSAPVARAAALSARLQPPQGPALAPVVDADNTSAQLTEVRFAAPLPEHTRLRLTLPAGLQDEGGRALANAAAFPLDLAIGGLPPLARFAGAPFGIVEAARGPEEPALLPLTLRHVQADLAGASTAGEVALLHLGPDTDDRTLLRWIGELATDHRLQYETRAKAMLAGRGGVTRAELPQLKDSTPRATEVIGVPLPRRGYHVVEVRSQILGQSLLAQRAPMYARTGALVTNLGVHFKRGRSSSLVWVTTLDRGRPVAGARVAVNGCRGEPLWSGSTDAAGLARIDRGFDEDYGEHCLTGDGYFVTARAGDDLGFVFSRWSRGIEPWRFDIPVAGGVQPDRRAHTVLARSLLRRGETVQMKHFVRDDGERGPALPPVAELPAELLITHVGSGTEHRLPLAWPRGARSASGSWTIPANAALGLYELALQRGDRRLPSGTLRVEDFRVPLVDARLSGPAGVQVAPGEIAFGAQVNAMAGGPMPGLALKLSALLRPAGVQFAGHEDFRFDPPGPATLDDEAPTDGGRIVARELPATTDARGAARFTVAGLPALEGPSDLSAELSFADPNGEVQTVARQQRLWPAAVVAGLRVPGWAAARGRAAFTAVVLDTTGRPLAGRDVQVSARQHQTLTTRKRIVGGFYAYDNRRQTRELGALCSGRTDARGRLGCDVALAAAGEVELVATARDDAGRASRAATSLWVSAEEPWWFEQDNDDRIDLLPEQRELEPGQTARLQVRMPYRQATALVSVEREGILQARVVQLSGTEPVIELPVPADGAWAPNVTVSVLVLRGRLREAPWWSLFTWGWRDLPEWWQAFRYEGRDWRAPGALADLAKPGFKLGVAQLRIGLAGHRLDVAVLPDKPQYGVREKARTTVRVSFQGRPAAGAEVAFAAVDEGLLALQPNTSWDLLGAMMQPRPWGVQTATAQGQIVGRRHYGRKALPPGGGGGRNPTRELFDTQLLWRDTVTLDARGEAQVEVPLNDSLTSFRLVAIADDGAARFGSGSASVRVTQDLQMLSGLAPLAREGDRYDAGFTLRNTTARKLTVQATLAGAVAGGAALALPPQTVELAAGAATELRWPVQVPAGATRIDWTAAAQASDGSARDRLQVSQAVQPAVPLRVWQASLQALDGSLAIPTAPPADALPGSGRLVATLQPRLATALPGLRRYFEAYPYTCLEQQASRSLALDDAAAWERLRGELPGYLDADGLASYFPPSPGSAARGSDKLTAYLLSAAHEAGKAWPEAAREAMLGGLKAFVEGRLERRFNAPRPDLDMRKLAALEALARHGRAEPAMLGSIAWTPAAWPSSALLDAWGLLRRVPGVPDGAARLDEVQRLLRSRLLAGGTALRFSTEDSDDWWWLMEGADANALRLLLAAVDVPAWQAELPQLLTGALARQRRGAWLTTTANLWGTLALQRYAARFEAVPVAGRTRLQLAAASAAHDWQAAPEGGSHVLAAAAAPFNARHEGSGRPWLTLQALAAVPLKAPLDAGYRIRRSVVPVQRQREGAYSRGDTVRVRIEIEAQADRSWVVVADPLPSGATVLGTGLGRDSAIATRGEQRAGGGWLAYKERAADAYRAYFEWLPRGRQVLEYTLRLNTAGRLQLPPTRVEAMYAPDSYGESPNDPIEVLP